MGLQLCSGKREDPKIFLAHQLLGAAEELAKEDTILDEKRESSNEVRRLSKTRAVACWNYYGKDESQTSEQKVIVPSSPENEVSREVASRDSWAVNDLTQIGIKSRDSRVVLSTLENPSSSVSILKPVEVIKEATNFRMSLDQSSTEGEELLERPSVGMISRTSSVRKVTDKELIDLGLEAYITSKREGLPHTPLSLLHRKISKDLLTSQCGIKSSLNSKSITIKKEEPPEELLKIVDNSTPRPIDQEADEVEQSSSLLTGYFVIK